MEWTKQKPSEPGYYWYREGSPEEGWSWEAEILQVVGDLDPNMRGTWNNLRYSKLDYEGTYKLAELSGMFWSTPIVQPPA